VTTRRGLIILDRDGVINRESTAFIKSPDEWLPLPGSIAAIGALSRAGFVLAIASNQSGLARDLLSRATLRAIHRKLRRAVAAERGHIARIVVCPHGPDDGCSCRKPRPGLLQRLGRHFGTSLLGVPFIGDSLKDLQAADSAGAEPILVRTGNGAKTEAALSGRLRSVRVFDDLGAAAAALIQEP
jgi:D-glycero-D-manno-heptose 1,7-bisphosphate phosphatase